MITLIRLVITGGSKNLDLSHGIIVPPHKRQDRPPLTGRAVFSKPKSILLRFFGFLFLCRNKPDRCSSDCKNYTAKQSKEQSRVRPEANEKVR